MSSTFTEAYKRDPTYGDTLDGEEIFGLDPDTTPVVATISKGTKLNQIAEWLKNWFIQLNAGAVDNNIAIWDGGTIIDSGISINVLNNYQYKTIATFIENQLSDDGVELLRHPVVTPFLIETDAVGSQYSNGVSPTLSAVFTLKYNAASIGTMTIDTGGGATFAVTSQVCNTGGVLTIEAPTPADASIANIGINLRTLRI